MIITRASLLSSDDSSDLSALFHRDNTLNSAYSENSSLRSKNITFESLIASANLLVLTNTDLMQIGSRKSQTTSASSKQTNTLKATVVENDLLVMNDEVAALDGGPANDIPIELQLFAPSRSNLTEGEVQDNSLEEEDQTIPLDAGSTITQQLSRLFPRR
jgi:hypothetical protein